MIIICPTAVGGPFAEAAMCLLSESHIRATGSLGGAQFYPNVTGDLKTDIKKPSSTLPIGAKVRLMFPQEALSDDGCVAMGAMCIDQDMNLTTGWVIVCNTTKEERYMHNFDL